MTSLGVRKLILDFALLKMEDHGKYECIMERGKDEVYSKKVEMIVIGRFLNLRRRECPFKENI